MGKETAESSTELTPQEQITANWIIKSFAFGHGEPGRQGTYLVWIKQRGEYDISQDIPVDIPDVTREPKYRNILQNVHTAARERHPEKDLTPFQTRDQLEGALRAFKRIDAAFNLAKASREQVFHGWLESFRK
jgi:hypothetical protein